MKFTRIAFAVAVTCGLQVSSVWAAPPRQANVQRTAYSYYEQDQAQPSPSDAPPPAAPVGDSASCGCVDVCELAEEETCDPWRLFDQGGCWTFTGFINASATANADRPASHYNGPVT